VTTLHLPPRMSLTIVGEWKGAAEQVSEARSRPGTQLPALRIKPHIVPRMLFGFCWTEEDSEANVAVGIGHLGHSARDKMILVDAQGSCQPYPVNMLQHPLAKRSHCFSLAI